MLLYRNLIKVVLFYFFNTEYKYIYFCFLFLLFPLDTVQFPLSKCFHRICSVFFSLFLFFCCFPSLSFTFFVHSISLFLFLYLFIFYLYHCTIRHKPKRIDFTLLFSITAVSFLFALIYSIL